MGSDYVVRASLSQMELVLLQKRFEWAPLSTFAMWGHSVHLFHCVKTHRRWH